MELNATTMIICLLIGTVSGVTSALCGVGGGIIMVPAFVGLLGLTQKHAVATSLAAIVLTALAASARNTQNNLVDWRVAILTGLAAALTAWFASGWLKSLSNVTLTRAFAIVVLVMGAHMLWSTRNATSDSPPEKVVDPIEKD